MEVVQDAPQHLGVDSTLWAVQDTDGIDLLLGQLIEHEAEVFLTPALDAFGVPEADGNVVGVFSQS